MKKFEHYDLLKEMVAKKYISIQKHPTLPLYIYKYTISVPFEKMWNPATLAARGLVLDENGIQYNSPMPKFFNLEELEANGLSLPDLPYIVYRKLDGSLIQVFFYMENLIFTSSGSFSSPHVFVAQQIAKQKGYDILMEKYKNNTDAITFIFEIIC